MITYIMSRNLFNKSMNQFFEMNMFSLQIIFHTKIFILPKYENGKQNTELLVANVWNRIIAIYKYVM